MSNTPSVTVHYAQAILQAAERLALPLPAELREPSREARIPLARQDELWEAFCAGAGDPLIGLRLGHALQVGHLDMVGALLMSCETLGEALEALLEYYPIVGEGGRVHPGSGGRAAVPDLSAALSGAPRGARGSGAGQPGAHEWLDHRRAGAAPAGALRPRAACRDGTI